MPDAYVSASGLSLLFVDVHPTTATTLPKAPRHNKQIKPSWPASCVCMYVIFWQICCSLQLSIPPRPDKSGLAAPITHFLSLSLSLLPGTCFDSFCRHTHAHTHAGLRPHRRVFCAAMGASAYVSAQALMPALKHTHTHIERAPPLLLLDGWCHA